jgi:mannose-6-phosphate isomerase-like protein (cupin superfamily)
MKIYAMGLDPNNRSIATFVDVPLKKISDTEAISAKQDGVLWRVGFREVTDLHRTSRNFERGAGPYEMHVGGPPHFIGIMSGHGEITMQDGGPWRLAAGEFLYVAPGAVHHSNNPSTVPVTIFNLLLPGTPNDTKPYVFKQA